MDGADKRYNLKLQGSLLDGMLTPVLRVASVLICGSWTCLHAVS